MKTWTCKDFDGWLFAHRGYHREPDAPENSLKAFELAVENGFGAELDVHLCKDGTLAILHDSKLKRLTGKKGVVEDLTKDQLGDYPLGQSTQTIPTLAQVLDVFKGRTPLIIELKPVNGNEKALTEAVCKELETYDGPFCIESFYPGVLTYLKANYPQIVRGQLAMNYFNSKKKMSLAETVVGTNMIHGFWTKPDFIAYRFSERANFGNRFWLGVMKKQGASWTIHNKEELDQALAEGLWPIFENFDPATGERLPGAKDT